MPVESIAAVSVVIAIFTIFALTLAWASSR